MSAAPPAAGLSIVFAGTPNFAVPCLESLARSRHRVTHVVTTPDRPAGRGLRAAPSPVRRAADALSIPVVLLPARDPGALADFVEGACPDMVTVVAWGGLLSGRCIRAPRLAAVNVHASLLPRYRGAAPIERALLAGESTTGVTVMYLAEELDAGDILIQREVAIPPGADSGRMRAMLAAAGAELLVRAADLLSCGLATRTAQDERFVSWAPKLRPADERMSWHAGASEIVNRVRALSPRPGAFFTIAGERVHVLQAGVAQEAAGAPGRDARSAGPQAVPGSVLGRRGDSLLVAAGDDTAVVLDVVRPAGGRTMSGAAWANGRRLARGSAIQEGGAD
ncbi:MAG: methionyl-tRNA formyltransferase [Bacillota bacterium]|nr:methionyl-tRNA formyltransferase [Bacillota bacterium]